MTRSYFTSAELIDMFTNGNSVGEKRLYDNPDWKIYGASVDDAGSAELDLERVLDGKKLVVRINPSDFATPLIGVEERAPSVLLYRISIAMQEFTAMVGLDRFENGEVLKLIQRQPQLSPIE